MYQEGGRLICKECSSLKIKKEKGYEEKDFILESLLNEVKNINRTLTYETVSWLNIIAAVVQCFVLVHSFLLTLTAMVRCMHICCLL